MRGIVLLCVADAEHKFYGDWAHNMALSIRAHSSLPIQVINDMSAQWGHGYWKGMEKAMATKPKHVWFTHCWKWSLRHCWWINIKKPVRLDFAWPHSISITVLGMTWVLH